MLHSVNLSRSGKDGKTGGDGFRATPEELKAIHEKLKDPVFAQLMHEYMQSLEDPETRREEEAYLEQAEREAREGGDFSFTFVFPRAAFAVELLEPSTRTMTAKEAQKVSVSATPPAAVRSFVNICSSDKVEEARNEVTGDSNLNSNWFVPVSVSSKRVEWYSERPPEAAASAAKAVSTTQSPPQPSSQKDGELCFVYDAVYHPKTLFLAERSARFMSFLVEIAVEQINAQYEESNGFRFHRLPSAVGSIGIPQNQTIRTKKGQSPFEVDREAPALTKPTKHISSSSSSSAAAAKASTNTAAAAADKQTKAQAAAPSSSSSTTTKPTVAAPQSQQTTPAATSALPPYTITHRGHINLSHAWQTALSEQRVGVPEALVVKLTFAGVQRASALAITVSEDGTAVCIEPTAQQPRYHGSLVLPFSVEVEPESAKFERTSGVLTVVLKVIPPPAPRDAAGHTVQDLQRALHEGTLHGKAEAETEEGGGGGGGVVPTSEAGAVSKRESASPSSPNHPVSPPPVLPQAEPSPTTATTTETISSHSAPQTETANGGEVHADAPPSTAADAEHSDMATLPNEPEKGPEEHRHGGDCATRPTEEAAVSSSSPPFSSSSAASAAPPPATTTASPVFDHISDTSRVQAVLDKVQEARRAREAAAAAASAGASSGTSEEVSNTATSAAAANAETETSDSAAEGTCAESEQAAAPSGHTPVSGEASISGDQHTTSTATTTATDAQPSASPSQHVAPSHCDATATHTETTLPSCSETNTSATVSSKSETATAKEGAAGIVDEAAEALRARQRAWYESVQAEIAASETATDVNHRHRQEKENTEEEAKERNSAGTDRATQRALARAQETERAEARLREKRAALPLSNKHLFMVD